MDYILFLFEVLYWDRGGLAGCFLPMCSVVYQHKEMWVVDRN